jgi:raffinose/stachyose/melibiose transport system permease protein
MPLMYPALATVVILTFVAWWGELIWATVALSSTSTIRTLSLGILSFQGQFGTNWGPLSAAICIILLPLMIIFLMLQKYFVQGVTGGAVKG